MSTLVALKAFGPSFPLDRGENFIHFYFVPRRATLKDVFIFVKKLNMWLTAPKGARSTRLLQLTGRWQYDGIM